MATDAEIRKVLKMLTFLLEQQQELTEAVLREIRVFSSCHLPYEAPTQDDTPRLLKREGVTDGHE